MTPARTHATVILAAITSVLLLGGCSGLDVENTPELAGLTGKTLKEARKIAEQAGYKDVEGHAADSYAASDTTDISYHRNFLEDDPAYASWTVCSQASQGRSTDQGGGWVLLLYMVEKPSDCKDGKLSTEALKRYVAIAKEEEELANESDEEEAPGDDYLTIYDPDFTYTGDFASDTGLPDPEEQRADGSYRYSSCEGADYVTYDDCYPAEWWRVYEAYREKYGW